MKFNSQICTTKEQSERLLALGLKKATADMCLHTSRGVSYTFSYNEALYFFKCKGFRKAWVMKVLFPTWSLHRLIELSGMGIIDTTTDSIYDKVIQYIEFLIKCGDFNKKYLEE